MTWGVDYDRDEYEDRERDYAFEVTCGACGAVRLNTDPEDCCAYSGGSQSYSSADASRWNRHLDPRDR